MRGTIYGTNTWIVERSRSIADLHHFVYFGDRHNTQILSPLNLSDIQHCLPVHIWRFPCIYNSVVPNPYLETRINLIPFQSDVNATWWDYSANIAMLIPFPILLYGIRQKETNGFILAGAGIGLSLLIEIIQYFTHRGICDIDDLILNSIGAIIGMFIALLFSRTIKRK